MEGINTVIRQCRMVFFLVLVFFVFSRVEAQSEVVINPTIQQMLSNFAAKNKAQETIRAWRIQVAALSDRREMENEKTRFENIYPYMELEWTYDNPYYILKLRDAAFKDKLTAYNLLHRIKQRYPSALLVLDDVKPEKVLNNPDY